MVHINIMRRFRYGWKGGTVAAVINDDKVLCAGAVSVFFKKKVRFLESVVLDFTNVAFDVVDYITDHATGTHKSTERTSFKYVYSLMKQLIRNFDPRIKWYNAKDGHDANICLAKDLEEIESDITIKSLHVKNRFQRRVFVARTRRT